MKSLKTVVAIALAVLMCVLATSAFAAPADGKTEIKVGWAQNESGESMNRVAEVFEATLKEWNDAGNTPTFTMVRVNAESNVDTQIANIDALINQKCDVIFSNAVDTIGILPAIDKARAAGIVWIEMRGVQEDRVDYNVSLSEEVLAAAAIEWWHNVMDSNPDLVINAGLIYGLASQTMQLIRVDALKDDLLKNYPDRFFVVATTYGDWDTNKSMNTTEDWMKAHRTMNCVITAGAQMALGAVQAVVSAGGDMDEWWFTTTDATSDALSMLNRGQLDMTVAIDVPRQIRENAEALIQIMTGTYSGPKLIENSLNCVFPIDASNIAQYYNN